MNPGEDNDFRELPFSDRLCRRGAVTLEDFVRRHSAAVFSRAMRRVRNYHDAEEIANDTFLRAEKGLPRFRGDSRQVTWLFKICDNLCIDRWRQKRLDCVSLDELLSNWPVAECDLSRLAAAERELELLLDLQQKIRALPAEEQWAFLLIEVCGFSVKQAAAEIVRVPRTTLSSRRDAAAKRLAAEFSEPPQTQEGA